MTTKYETVCAIDLTGQHLGHEVIVTEYTGKEVSGVLTRVELPLDTAVRVVVRVATKEATEGGGFYWATFADERYLNRDSSVLVGDPLPSAALRELFG